MRDSRRACLLACLLGWPFNVYAQATEPAPVVAPAPDPPDPPSAPDAPDTTPPKPQAVPATDPSAPAPPAPPATTGDYAGHGSASSTARPQEDFAEAEAPEYHRPEKHEYSVRIDALNWLLLGRLRVELEASVWKFISVELLPVFVTSPTPITVNYASLDRPLTQHSNGLGPLSGASLGVGFWLSGTPFRGYVIRLNFTNYGYLYRTADAEGGIDRVRFTERRIAAFFGSHSRFGPFTFAGGFGLGYELHQVDRCGLANVSTGSAGGTVESIAGRTSGCHGKQLIALDRTLSERADLNGPLHPVYFEARFSVGVVF